MRSLAEDIRSRGDDELARLLTIRPDLARPRPADLTALAARAGTHASTARAVDHLDLTHLVALQACVAADGAALDVATVAEQTGVEPDATADLLDDLRTAALLWRSPDGTVPTRTVQEVLARDVATLGPPLAGLGGVRPDALDHLRDQPPEAVAVLRRLAWQGPSATRPDGGSRAGEAVAALIAEGLLVADGDQVTMPLEVGLRVRAGTADPPVTPTTRGVEHADRVAAGAIGELVADADELLRQVDRLRPRVLRSGGLAVRDLRELGRRSGLDEPRTLLLLEMTREADLLADDRAAEPTWRLTTGAEPWHDAEPAPRWRDLVVPWLASLRAPVIQDEDGPRGALSEDLAWPPVRALRRELLAACGDLPAGSITADALVDALRRRRPRRMPHDAGGVAAAVLEELAALGLVALGALTAAGRALADDPADERGRALAAVAGSLPEPVDRAMLQADLTAVVPGMPTAGLADLLRSAATLESRGGAAVFRFTETSVRAALDAGWAADELLDAVERASATGVPQPLSYLVRDVARRHGTLRAGSVASYLRSDDPAHLEALARHRDLGHLRLRQVAPTVLVSPVGAAVLLESLREIGATPVLEGAGGVVSSGPTARRVPPPRRRPVTEVAPEPPLRVVAALREAEERPRPEPAPGPGVPSLDPVSSAALLRDAAADRLPVWVGVTDAVGSTTRLLFSPLRVDGGRVVGEVDGTPRTLSLHRITGVAAASAQP